MLLASCGVHGPHAPDGSSGLLGSSIAGSQLAYNGQILKIFQARCTPCHAPGNQMGLPNWQDYDTVFAKKALIYQRAVVARSMPPAGASTITDDERSQLGAWINAGAPKQSSSDGANPAPVPSPVPAPDPTPTPEPTQPSGPPTPLPILQKKVEYCISCHLASGAGFQGEHAIPRLAGQSQEYLYTQLSHFADHTRDNPASKQFMWEAVSGLTPEMKRDLAAYFASLKTPPSGGGPGGHEALGKTIFEEGIPSRNVFACNLCHGVNAEGNGPMPRLAGQGYEYIKTMFKDWRNGYRADAAPMPDFAKALTDEEIESLAEYLSEHQ